jgi:hypothetical protein
MPRLDTRTTNRIIIITTINIIIVSPLPPPLPPHQPRPTATTNRKPPQSLLFTLSLSLFRWQLFISMNRCDTVVTLQVLSTLAAPWKNAPGLGGWVAASTRRVARAVRADGAVVNFTVAMILCAVWMHWCVFPLHARALRQGGGCSSNHTRILSRGHSPPPPPRTHAHICKHTHAHRGKRTAILFQGELQSSFPRCLLWVMVLGRVCHSPSARYGAPAHLTAQVEDGDGPHTVEDCAAARPPFGLDQRRHALQPAPSCRHPRWRKFTFRASNEEPQG